MIFEQSKLHRYITNSPEETTNLGIKLARERVGKKVFALTGDLGAGKTTFIQGFAKGLGIGEKVISPTFVFVRQYKIPDSKITFYHIDLYRADKDTDLSTLGLEEILSNKNSLVLLEWAEKYQRNLPRDCVYININYLSNNQREFIIR